MEHNFLKGGKKLSLEKGGTRRLLSHSPFLLEKKEERVPLSISESREGGGGNNIVTYFNSRGNLVKNGGRILHNTFYTLSYSLSASLFSFVSG